MNTDPPNFIPKSAIIVKDDDSPTFTSAATAILLELNNHGKQLDAIARELRAIELQLTAALHSHNLQSQTNQWPADAIEGDVVGDYIRKTICQRNSNNS